jgi:hypothetical protein
MRGRLSEEKTESLWRLEREGEARRRANADDVCRHEACLAKTGPPAWRRVRDRKRAT